MTHLDKEQDVVVKSSSDVRSLTYCDLQCISLTGLKQSLHMYPELAKQCATDIANDLTYNLREGFNDSDDNDCTVIPAVTLQLINNETPTATVYFKQCPMCNIKCRISSFSFSSFHYTCMAR